MDFLADENVSRRIVDGLRGNGHDVLLVSEFLPGGSDDAVIVAAQEQGRIIITEGTDFGELIIRRQLAVSGVVLLELDRLSAEAEARRVNETIAQHGDKLAGNLVVVEPGRIRMRPLPK